jgi:polyhydroxyalkanoate synthase
MAEVAPSSPERPSRCGPQAAGETHAQIESAPSFASIPQLPAVLVAGAVEQGSWWPAWTRWLAERSGPPMPVPAIDGAKFAPLADAPGTYVLEP